MVLSLYQCLILLLFNEFSSLKASEIRQKTRLADIDLTRTLQSLSLGKVKLLTKVPMTKQVLDTDLFELNEKFQHPLTKIVVNQIQAEETKQESKQTLDKCIQDRTYLVDAGIVRIMKREKTITMKKLLPILFGVLLFPLEVMMVD